MNYEDQLRDADRTIRKATEGRDSAIISAAAAGMAKTSIAEMVGLSRMQVHRIVAAAEASDARPMPKTMGYRITVETDERFTLERASEIQGALLRYAPHVVPGDRTTILLTLDTISSDLQLAAASVIRDVEERAGVDVVAYRVGPSAARRD
ncbi:hypothetical protein [Microbacterium karelineae]|uniref:hypothetical protein n=1 Tax=Microbacterium karelineae TaxID=2654283 RepID=UPI0012EAE1D3|nr:hypothetical protein [Microbacterium karelineae]